MPEQVTNEVLSFMSNDRGVSRLNASDGTRNQRVDIPSAFRWLETTLSVLHGKAVDAAPPAKAGNWCDATFIHAIPGTDAEPGVVVLADGTMRAVVSCTGINALLFDPEERDRLGQELANLANSIDFDIQIVVTSRNLPVDEYLSRYQSQINTKDEFLRWYANHTDHWFRGMQEITYVPLREFYVIVSYIPPDCKTKLGNYSWSGHRSTEAHDRFAAIVNRNAKHVRNQLQHSGLDPKILDRGKLRDLIFQHLNPALSESSPLAPRSTPAVTEASTLARSGLRIERDHLWLDGNFVATQYLKELPHDTWTGWLVELLCLNAQYTLSIFVHACDQVKIKKRLRQHFRFSFLASTSFQGAPDVDTCDDTQSAQEAIRYLNRTSNKAVDVSAYIKTFAPNLEELQNRKDEIARVFSNRGAILGCAKGMQFEAWQSCLPVGVDKLEMVRTVTAPVAGTFWPFFSAGCGTPDGVPLGFAVASGEPVLLNPFYQGDGKDANNMFVVGSTGAGKSFAVQMLIMRLLPLGMRFVVIDKTVDRHGSYRFITELLGPQLASYVDLGPSRGLMLNPFDLGREEEDGTLSEPTQFKVTKLLELLDLMLVSEGREELEIEQKSLLDRLIRMTYRECALRGRVPTMSDLLGATNYACRVEQDPEQRTLLRKLSRGLSMYTRGSAFGGMVDGQTNIDVNRLMLVFDTREVTDPRLERIMAYILTDFIERRASESKEEEVRMAAIVDEAATLMRFKAGAELLEALSRRARHYGLMLITITQQLKDFFRQAEIADSVVKNAHMKVILRQDPSDLEMLKEALMLTNTEKQAIANLGSRKQKRKDSQCLLIVAGSHGIIRIVPSPMDYWICTSEPIKDIPARRRQIKAVKDSNPKINHTDACRQAVFILATQPRD